MPLLSKNEKGETEQEKILENLIGAIESKSWAF